MANSIPSFGRSEWSALRNAVAAVALLAVAIALGSRGFRDFDTALTHYAVISLVALFATVHRLTFWFERPPTRVLFIRAARNLFSGALRGPRVAAPVAAISRPLLSKFAIQNFIRNRGWKRWLAHLCLSWGSTLAFAVTFPLVFGWVHFEASAGNAEAYQVRLFGFFAGAFWIHSALAFLAFNALNLSAILVLIGVTMAAARRLTDSGDRATETLADDWLPLFILFAVAATGLALTVDTRWFAGEGFRFLALVHAAAVGLLLLYIPFGKLLHIFQRTSSLAVAINKKAAETGARAQCVRCREDFASAAQIEDLKRVQQTLGFSFIYAAPQVALSRSGVSPLERKRRDAASIMVHYQDVCPPCRRRLLSLNQGRGLGR